MSLFLLHSCHKGKTIAVDEVSNDSITKYLEYANEDSISIQKRLQFNNRAFEILKQRDNDSVTRALITESAVLFYNNDDLPSFKKFTNLLYTKSEFKNDSVLIAKSYRFKYEYFKLTTQNDSAFYYILKAEKSYLTLQSDFDLGKVFLDKGRIQYLEEDYFGAELSITKAYSIFSKLEDMQRMYECMSIIGTIANDLKDYSRALDFHGRAYDFAKNNKLDNGSNQLAISLNNIGNVYQNLNQNEKAIPFFEDALNSNDGLLVLSPELYSLLIDNLAYSKLQVNNLEDLPKLFFESHEIRDSLNLDYSLVFSKIHISEYFAKQLDTATAIRYANHAYSLAKSLNSPVSTIATLKQLSNVNPRTASKYGKEYIEINDSLQNEDRKSKDKFARIQFETDEISHQKDMLEEQNRNLFSFFVGTIMIILLLFIIRTQRAKNRELLLREAQQKANEEIYNLMLSQQNKMEEGRIKEKKKIAQELHDGVLGRLFGARLNLDSLNKIDGADAESKRNNYLTELKNIEQDIREISHDLSREKSALINNFVAIFNNLLEEQAAAHSSKVISNISEDIKWDKINNNLKINIYRITQEALQNINKYAKADRITINISTLANSIQLSIVDNGIGFDIVKKSKGIGMQNITSRAQHCNGLVDITSVKGEGTHIKITFQDTLTDDIESKNKIQKPIKKWLQVSTS